MRVGRDEVPPRDDPDNREINREVDHGNRYRADENRPWDDPTGMLDFVADIADVVVAEVVVDADPRRGAEAHEETQGETERTWWKVEGDPGVEVRGTGHDDHDDGDDRADPERDGNRRDRRDPPVEECEVREPDDRDDEHRLTRRDPPPDVAQALRDAELPGQDIERHTAHDRP